VRGVRLRGSDVAADHVVLCSGAWTRFFEEAAGARLPVEPVRGQMLALESPQPPLAHIVWGEDAYLVPRRDGSLLVGATVERAGFDARTTAGGIAALALGAAALLPELAGATFLRAWAGLRPATPDGLPLIGAVPAAPGLVVASGHYRRGILMAPITAFWVAELLARGRLPSAAEPFAPARLAG
jgi:glycine oxidase